MGTKLLSVGMSTYDDFDGVYFTIQALRMYHNIFKTNDVEIIVIDNNPEGIHGKEIEKLSKGWLSHIVRYIPYTDKASTSVRNEIFKNSSAKYTISIDCHVMIESGGIDSLLDYYKKNPDCKDLIQGPLWYDDLKNYATEFSPVWRGDMYGIWHANQEACEKGDPFDIPMMGLGLFSCETKNWPGFNQHFRGFGGEEGYIHEKFRRNGGRCVCLPGLKWVHRFGRPNGVKYPLVLEDRIWNYFIGWLEITQDPEHEMILSICEHFKNRLPLSRIHAILEEAKRQIFANIN